MGPNGEIGGSASSHASSEQPLWTPSAELLRGSGYARYLAWLARQRGLEFAGYRDLWAWSVEEIEAFWASIWGFFGIRATTAPTTVLETRVMPGTRWFQGARLNYAAHALSPVEGSHPALLFRSESAQPRDIGWDELRGQVASVAASLRELGVGPGDRVAGYLANVPEAVVGFLACAAIGAVWTACSPDFGAAGALERFRGIEPKVLIATDGHAYAGRRHDRRAVVAELTRSLPTLRHTVAVPYLDRDARVEGAWTWAELLARDAALLIEPLPFDHPLWILFSSGTTGPPKAIVHGHGGILLEHLKTLVLQQDVRAADRVFWHTTTGWMMWNRLVGGLLAGATVVLYDGSPGHPDPDVLWRLAEDDRITHFGAGARVLVSAMNAGLRPSLRSNLEALRMITATGSPLPTPAYRWVYDSVKAGVWLASSSGGTDVATALLGACPGLPVYAGELQGAALGVRAEAWDESGRPVVGRVGELVVTRPLPSMPLYFWNDPEGDRYRASYFDRWPGVWRHGDRVSFTERGSAVILGRSDGTLNRHGVRIGTAEIYRVVEAVPGVADSLVVGVDLTDGGYWMPLFLVMRAGATLDEPLRDEIRRRIRSELTARHLPDEILEVDEVPRTRNGKKLEVPVKRILAGEPTERVVSLGSLENPGALLYFERLAARRAAGYRSVSAEEPSA